MSKYWWPFYPSLCLPIWKRLNGNSIIKFFLDLIKRIGMLLGSPTLCILINFDLYVFTVARRIFARATYSHFTWFIQAMTERSSRLTYRLGKLCKTDKSFRILLFRRVALIRYILKSMYAFRQRRMLSWIKFNEARGRIVAAICILSIDIFLFIDQINIS